LRPVNLIPADQRRGGRRVGAGRLGPGGIAVYGLLGVLAIAVIGMGVLVLTSNRINDQKSKVAALGQDQASAKAAADALRPYGNFAQLQQARVETVNSLVNTAFNWERVLRQFSRTIPSDAWLTSLTATVAPGIGVTSSGGGSGGGTGFREQAQAPAVEMTGCTYSHRAVARMMTSMRNMDNVTQVVLGSSERPTGQVSSGGEEGEDCRKTYKVTKFQILVVLGDANIGQPVAPAPGAPTTPVASAQAAVATTQQASANAGGGQ
jgi:Tfp pilus assembly protein PilN